MSTSSESVSEVHVLGAVSNPVEAVQTILDRIQPGGVLLDLSAGELVTPHLLESRVQTKKEVPDELHWLNGQEYADECGAGSRRAYVEWLAHQANEPLAGGKSVKELFTYKEEVALWWFTPMATKHVRHHSFRWLFYMIFVLRRIRTEYVAGAWHVWTDDEQEGQILRSVLESEGRVHTHAFDEGGSTSLLQTFWRTAGGTSLERFGRSVWWLIRQSLLLVLFVWNVRVDHEEQTEEQEKVKNFDVLVQTGFPKSWTEVPNDRQFDPEVDQYDRYFGRAPWDLKSDGLDVAWLPTLHSRDQVRQWAQMKNRQTLPDVGKALQVSWWTVCQLLFAAWRWWARFYWTFGVCKAHRRWRYQDLDLGGYLYREMWRLAAGGGLRYAQQIEQYRAAHEAVQPAVVLYRDEFYRSGRAVTAALKDRTQLIGVQHGLIGREHTVYQIHPSELPSEEEGSTDHVYHNPVPNHFASFDNSFKELFEAWGGYPSNRVWPVGGLRHDELLEQYQDLPAKGQKRIREALELPVDRPVIVLCTGVDYTVRLWSRWVMRAVEGWSESPHVAVKIHQYHGAFEDVHVAARDVNYSRYTVHEENIYPLMASADAVVGGGSTILWEANLFHVPAVALTIPAAYQHYPFGDLDRCAVASTVDSLRSRLEQIIHGRFGTDGERSPALQAKQKASIRLARKIRLVS